MTTSVATGRALPASVLGAFVRALAPIDDLRRDSDLFGGEARNGETQRRVQAAERRGPQTRHAEMQFAAILDDLATYSQRREADDG